MFISEASSCKSPKKITLKERVPDQGIIWHHTCKFANMRIVPSIKHLSRYFKVASARKLFFAIL